MGKRKHHPCSVMPYGFLDFFENAKKAQHFVIRAVGKQLSDFLVRHGVCAGCICPQNPVGCHIERLCNADECGQPRRFLAEFNVGEMHHRNIRFSASSPCVSPTSRRRSAMRPPMAEGLQFLFIAFHPFACNTNGDCTSGFAHGNTVSVFFHLPYRNIFVCCNPCHCAHLLCKHTQYHKGGMKSSESGKVSN